jgi:uncharacterized protein DUF6077
VPLLTVYLEGVVVTLAAWVVAYETVLYAGWPRSALFLLFPVLVVALGAAFLRSWRRRATGASRGERRFALGTLLLGGLVASLVLVASRPDADDVPYMLFPMQEAAQPGKALSVVRFRLPRDHPGLPVPGLNRNPAYESLVVTAAGVLGLDPLRAYHNYFAALVAITWTLTYAALLRWFRVPSRWVGPALVTTVVLLLLDGNVHRSFGNMSLLRIWQGKVVVFAVLIPLLLLFSLRALGRPSARAFGLVALVSITAVCLNRSAFFMVPILTVCVTLAYVISFGGTRHRLGRAAILILSVTPVLVLPAVALLASSPSMRIVAEIASGAAEATVTWWDTLRSATLGNSVVIARNASCFLLVFLCVKRPLNRVLPVLALVVCAVGLNPLTGPLWHRLLTTEAYWRLYYLIPLPLAFGLTVLSVRHPRPLRFSAGLRLAALALVAVTFALSFEKAALSSKNNVELKWPLEYRFRSLNLAFARQVAPLLAGKQVLAADPVANILALTQYQTIQLVYARAPYARPADPRTQADRVLSQCSVSAVELDALRSLLAPSVQFLVTRDCGTAHREQVETAVQPLALRERVHEDGFLLFEIERRE